jgi:hypothetical protein
MTFIALVPTSEDHSIYVKYQQLTVVGSHETKKKTTNCVSRRTKIVSVASKQVWNVIKCSTRSIVWSAGHLNGQKFLFVPNFTYFGFWFWNKLMTKIEFFFKIPTYVFECITFVHHALKIQICHKTLWGCKTGCFVLKNKIFLFENLEKKCFGRRNTEIALYVLWEEDCKIFICKEEKSRACFLNFFSKLFFQILLQNLQTNIFKCAASKMTRLQLLHTSYLRESPVKYRPLYQGGNCFFGIS